MLLHERDAFREMNDVLNKYQAMLPPVVIHCFTGNRHEAIKYVGMGYYIGITGRNLVNLNRQYKLYLHCSCTGIIWTYMESSFNTQSRKLRQILLFILRRKSYQPEILIELRTV